MATDYLEWIKQRVPVDSDSGDFFDRSSLHESLYEFQKDIVLWALRRGRAAVFAGCGLGKTHIQLSWADKVPGRVLILAPLAVARQTEVTAQSLGIPARYLRNDDPACRIVLANYEMLQHFDPASFEGIVLDESSILKSFDGKMRQQIIDFSTSVPWRLACTATPSPNDYMELGNHSEFLGVMRYTEMLATFFINDMTETAQWRLKKHGAEKFWQWVASWSVFINDPKDFDYDDNRFELAALNVIEHYVAVDNDTAHAAGKLFIQQVRGLSERRDIRKLTLEDRVEKCVEIVKNSTEPWLIWCDRNDESEMLSRAFPDAVEVKGSDLLEQKIDRLQGFASGKYKMLISKSSIAGFGMNYQHCSNMIFCGLSDSFERYYQAVRRCWRYGQTKPVNVHIVVSESERVIVANVAQKEEQLRVIRNGVIKYTKSYVRDNLQGSAKRDIMEYRKDTAAGSGWTMHLGDCVEVIKEIPPESVHYSIFSPPFAELYVYSNSERDMGNARSKSEFIEHFKYLIPELLRVTKPGRLLSMHCMQLPIAKYKDGYIGLYDFRGELIRSFIDAGWIYHSEVCIWKDPVTAMQRTKALGLLHKQIKKDSSMSRQGIADYLVTMRKPGDNPEPIAHTAEQFPVQAWQQYASPVWMDINPSRTLQFRSAKANEDEKHICLAVGSLVLTKCGYKPIEDIELGDLVLTHMGRWRPVLAKACTGINKVVQLKAQGVADLVLTPEHKLWTRVGTTKHPRPIAMKAVPEWIKAKDTVGSYVNLKLPDVEDSTYSAEEWWIVGRWIADGHLNKARYNAVLISCGAHELQNLLAILGDRAGFVQDTGTAIQIRIKDRDQRLRSLIFKCGYGAANKHLPPEAYTLPPILAKALLDGYLSGDGHYVESRRKWMASSISRELLLGIAFLTQRVLGVVASVYAGRSESTHVINGRTVNQHQDWIVSFNSKSAQDFSSFIQDDGAWKKVRSVEDVGTAETWNIEVAEDNSYTAEGCIVKNCPLQLDVIERA